MKAQIGEYQTFFLGGRGRNVSICSLIFVTHCLGRRGGEIELAKATKSSKFFKPSLRDLRGKKLTNSQ